MSLADKFDTNLPDWKAWQAAPWGRLRYAVARANLARHLPDRPLRILDAGGGNGADSIPLAVEGHAVTIIDFSAEMLAEAQHSATTLGVAERVKLMQHDLLAIDMQFAAPVFDVVLCHNVLQYTDDAEALIAALAYALKPGGILSLMSVNRYSEPYRAAFQQSDLAAARTLIGSTSAFTPMFDLRVKRYAAEDLFEALAAKGFELAGHYGVRCLSDYLQDEHKLEPAAFAELEQLEIELAGTFPYYLLARFFQLIAVKSPRL